MRLIRISFGIPTLGTGTERTKKPLDENAVSQALSDLSLSPFGGMIGGEEERMKLRIAIWVCVGALVVVFWTLYISASSPTPLGSAWTLVYLTCPIALARHYALSFYFVLLVNAGTYALVGTVAEAMRRQYKHNQPRLISN